LDESASQLKSAVEQAKRSANEVSHLSDELRREQERSATLERQRRHHEAQIKELQVEFYTLHSAEDVYTMLSQNRTTDVYS